MSEHRNSEELKHTKGTGCNMVSGEAGASQENVWIAAAMQEADAQKTWLSCLCRKKKKKAVRIFL